ncbi:hypothetical protein ACWIGI_00685 [Nocardia sp. NPDC055321]
MVPEWCGHFTTDEYALFVEEVDEALGCFGADGQDIDMGCVVLAVGDPQPCPREFSIVSLARRCRADNIDDWSSMCFEAVDSLTIGQPQQHWLGGMSFEQVAALLRPWVGDEPQTRVEAALDDPDQPFAAQLDTGEYLHLLATVPELEGIPEVAVFVTNSVVRSWRVSINDLVHWAGYRGTSG